MTPPTIADAKALATKCRTRGVLILAVGDGHFATASYGMTRAQCDALKTISNRIADLISGEAIEIPDALR